MLIKKNDRIVEVIRKKRNTIGPHYNIMDDELTERLSQETKLKEAFFETMVYNIDGPFIFNGQEK